MRITFSFEGNTRLCMALAPLVKTLGQALAERTVTEDSPVVEAARAKMREAGLKNFEPRWLKNLLQ